MRCYSACCYGNLLFQCTNICNVLFIYLAEICINGIIAHLFLDSQCLMTTSAYYKRNIKRKQNHRCAFSVPIHYHFKTHAEVFFGFCRTSESASILIRTPFLHLHSGFNYWMNVCPLLHIIMLNLWMTHFQWIIVHLHIVIN